MAFRFLYSFVLALSLAAGLQAAPALDARATVIVYNSNDPEAKELAEVYREAREIPEENVVSLAAPLEEEIPREEYLNRIANPLREIFAKNQWWRTRLEEDGVRLAYDLTIRYVALIRGMPLKIAPDPTIPAGPGPSFVPQEVRARNEAAVDSELAVLGLFGRAVAGVVPNPYFRRFAPILDSTTDPPILLVARLDAPSADEVRRMIRDSLAAEKNGLWGWAAVDARGITEGPYAEGDNWMRTLAAELQRNGMPVLLDEQAEVFPSGYPLPPVALYFGWYEGQAAGAFGSLGFRFEPGAVAVHIHSFSASSIRDPLAAWCAPLLVRGAAATLGNVYEPYLALTPNLDVFTERILTGLTLAESAYMSLRALSWMTTIIGDPLYRPFRFWNDFMARSPITRWAMYREAIRAAKSSETVAQESLRTLFDRQQDAFFLEALAYRQASSGETTRAIETLEQAERANRARDAGLRMLIERLKLLRKAGRELEARRLALEAVPRLWNPASKNLVSPFLPPTPTPSP